MGDEVRRYALVRTYQKVKPFQQRVVCKSGESLHVRWSTTLILALFIGSPRGDRARDRGARHFFRKSP
jgi:hypothetical protein